METLRAFTAKRRRIAHPAFDIAVVDRALAVERDPQRTAIGTAHMSRLIEQMLDLAQADGMVFETGKVVNLGQ